MKGMQQISKLLVSLSCVATYVLAGLVVSFESALPTDLPEFIPLRQLEFGGLRFALVALVPNLVFCVITRSRNAALATIALPLLVLSSSVPSLIAGVDICVLHSFGSTVCNSEAPYLVLDLCYFVGIVALVVLGAFRLFVGWRRGSRVRVA